MATRIVGVSGYLPEKIETNEDLAREHPSWDLTKIGEKTGILAGILRRWTRRPAIWVTEAAAKLLQRQLVPGSEIDYLIFSTQTPDHLVPPNACLLQRRLGLSTEHRRH